jgi:hypothetical protein
MAIDLGKTPRQKKYQLLPDELYSAKDAGAMADVALKRVYDLGEAGIIKPSVTVKKGDGIRDFTSYDSTNVLELFLVNRLTILGLPKRTIKDFFREIRGVRDSLNPFKIDAYQGVAYLCFVYDANKDIKFLFLDDQPDENSLRLDKLKGYSIYVVVNLSALVDELYKRVEALA